MNDQIQHAVEEAIRDAVSEQLSLIKFNLGHVFGGLLYSLKLELEKRGGVGDIDNLIRIVIDTTHQAGPVDESYPAYDKKAVAVILDRIEGVLQDHGIEQAWNIGKKAHVAHFESELRIKDKAKERIKPLPEAFGPSTYLTPSGSGRNT